MQSPIALIHGTGLAPASIQDDQIGVLQSCQGLWPGNFRVRAWVEEESRPALWGQAGPCERLVPGAVVDDPAPPEQEVGHSPGIGLPEGLCDMDEKPDIEGRIHGLQILADTILFEEATTGASGAALGSVARQLAGGAMGEEPLESLTGISAGKAGTPRSCCLGATR